MLVEKIKEAGIVGNGGAGFPTHVKLSAKAEYFIVNAAECEPLIETDKYLMRHKAKELIKGIEIIAGHLGATEKYIAIKAGYTEEIQCLEKEIKRLKVDIKFHKMKSFYPSGDEQVIVKEITGNAIVERGIPLEVGAVVHNVGTIINVYDMVVKKEITTKKYLSVVGAVKKPQMLKVPIGISIRECIKQAGPIGDYVVIMGGPMMGKVITDPTEMDRRTITKTDGNIIVLPPDHYLIRKNNMSLEQAKKVSQNACIQCRMCTDLCPRKALGQEVLPHLIMRNLYREHQIEALDEYEKAFSSAVNCSECGVCELYACPMQLSPRKINGYIKQCLAGKGIKRPRKPLGIVDPQRDFKKVPTKRLIARIGLMPYYLKERLDDVKKLSPKTVHIPVKQHIGAPSQVVVAVGERVEDGQLIASVPEGALGANIHASITGVVTAVGEMITITTEG